MTMMIESTKGTAPSLIEDAVAPSTAPWDPFVAPAPTARLADLGQRERVVVRGLVTTTRLAEWSGVQALEVSLTDGTGELLLAFFGRRTVAGIEPGQVVSAAGTVGRRQGRLLLLNPQHWLHPASSEPDHA